MDYNEEEFDDDFEEDYLDDDNEQDEDDLPEHQFEEVDPDEFTDIDDDDLDDDSQDPDGGNNDQMAAANEQEPEQEPRNEESSDDDDEESNPSTDDEGGDGDDTNQVRTRSERAVKPPDKLTMMQMHLHTQVDHLREKYSIESARIIATVMCRTNDILVNPKNGRELQFAQSYGLMKGLKKFGQRGKEAAHKEMKQLHDRVVFKPVRVEELTDLERKQALESLIFLEEKRDGTVKGRICANGSTQREYTEREEAASPTVMTE